MNVAFPRFEDVLHEAVLLEHGYLSNTWRIEVQFLQKELDQLFIVRIDCVPGDRENFSLLGVVRLLFTSQIKPWKVLSLCSGPRVGVVRSL